MNLLPCTCRTTLHGTRRTLVGVLLNGQRLMFRRACLKAVGPHRNPLPEGVEMGMLRLCSWLYSFSLWEKAGMRAGGLWCFAVLV